MRHKPAPECPHRMKIRLRYSGAGLFSLRHFFAPIFLLSYKIFQTYLHSFERGKEINCGLASTVQGINNALSFDFALKGALCEGAGSAMFFAETEGELLCLAWEPRQTEPAAKAAEEPKVNSPSPRFAGSSLREGAKIFGKSLFISFPVQRKSAFISREPKR